MSNLEKLSKENLIDELMLDTIKGGCCQSTARQTSWPNSTDSKQDRPSAGEMLVERSGPVSFIDDEGLSASVSLIG